MLPERVKWIFLLVLLCLLVSSASAWLAGYDYRQLHNITGDAGWSGDLSNYQVMFVVNTGVGVSSGNTIYLNSHSEADLDDLRFTSTSDTLYDYWIESTSNPYNVWVEIPTVLKTGNTQLYVYYGNASVSAYSNGTNTFSFFDDFPGSALDGAKWTTTSTPTISVSGGELTITTSDGKYIQSTNTHDVNTTIRARSKDVSGQPNSPYGYGLKCFPISTHAAVRDNYDATHYDLQTQNAASRTYSAGIALQTSYKVYEIKRISTSVVLTEDGTTKATITTTLPSGALSVTVGPLSGSTTCQEVFDWTLVRNYVSTEPAHSTWFAEECSGGCLPVAAFSANVTSGQAPLWVGFTDASTNAPTSWYWEFGDGDTDNVQNPVHEYTDAGTYTVNLSATNAVGSDWENKTAYITVTNVSECDIIKNGDFETGDFTNWSHGGGGGTETIDAAYAHSGSYGCNLDSGLASGNSYAYVKQTNLNLTRVTNITFWYRVTTLHDHVSGSARFELSIDGVTKFCRGDWVGCSGGVIGWTYVDIPISGYTGSTHYVYFGAQVWPDSGDAQIIADVDDIETVCGEFPPVAGFFGVPTSGYAPESVTFGDTSTNTPTSWYWDFGDGETNTTQNPVHIYDSVIGNTAAYYSVSLNASNTAGYDWENKTNYIEILPLQSSFSANVTSGGSGSNCSLWVGFTDSTSHGTPTAWDWDFGDGTAHGTTQNPIHEYTASGTYTVKLNASNAYSYDWENKTNYISDCYTLTADFYSTSDCGDGIGTLGAAPFCVFFVDDSINATSLYWDFGDGYNSTDHNPYHSFISPGNYTVRLKAINGADYDWENKTNYTVVKNSVAGECCSCVRESGKCGGSGTGINEYWYPSGITSDGNYIFVADKNNERFVKLYASNLSWIQNVSVEYAHDVATDGTNIYVAGDSLGGNKLWKYQSSDLSLVTAVPKYFSGIAYHDNYLYGTKYFYPNFSSYVEKLSAVDLSYVDSNIGPNNVTRNGPIENDGTYLYTADGTIFDGFPNPIHMWYASNLTYIGGWGTFGYGYGEYYEVTGFATTSTHLYTSNDGINTPKFFISNLSLDLVLSGSTDMTTTDGDPYIYVIGDNARSEYGVFKIASGSCPYSDNSTIAWDKDIYLLGDNANISYNISRYIWYDGIHEYLAAISTTTDLNTIIDYRIVTNKTGSFTVALSPAQYQSGVQYRVTLYTYNDYTNLAYDDMTITDINETIPKFPPHSVRFVLQDYFGAPLNDVWVYATPIETTLGSWSWLGGLFGMNITETNYVNTTMNGSTGLDGSIDFIMYPTIKYNITCVGGTYGINYQTAIYPQENEIYLHIPTLNAPNTSSSVTYTTPNVSFVPDAVGGVPGLNQWLALGTLLLVGTMFSKKSVKVAAVIVPLFGLFFYYIDWLEMNTMGLSILVSLLALGLLSYIRKAESVIGSK